MFRINLREMLMGENSKVRFINRFSTCHVVHKESVAEHCFFVAFYAQIIARWLEAEGYSVDWRKMMERALLHDMDEARTGDFFRPFKYSNPALKAMLEKAAAQAFEETVSPIFEGGCAAELQALCDHWEHAKAGDLEGAIIAFCDFLSVLSYMVLEVRVANITMKEHADSMRTYVATFRRPAFDPLGPLVQQAEELTEELLAPHDLPLRLYHIVPPDAQLVTQISEALRKNSVVTGKDLDFHVPIG